MASLLDRGDSYHVDFLGCAMLKSMATGLGALQKPLRELYLRHRLPGKDSRLQPRQLTITDRGILITFQQEEVFFGAPSIMFWDSVKFVAVKGAHKKVSAAFEPLDNDHSRNKDKIFTPLDKKQHYLQQLVHPSIFTCVLRRTSGVKALDLHAFVCHSDDEALGLVRAFNMVQSNFTSNQVSESGVFGYNPFGKDSVRATAGPNRSAVPQQPATRAVDRWAYGSTPSLDRIDHDSIHGQPVPTTSAVALLGLGDIKQSDLTRSDSRHRADANFPRPTTRSKSYHQLTQEDLVPSPENSLSRLEVYEYSEHITGSLDRTDAGQNPFYQGANRADSPPNTRTHPPKTTTGQGYSLLGTAATPPGYHGPRSSRAAEQEQPRVHSPSGYQRTIERTPSRAGHPPLLGSNTDLSAHAGTPPRESIYAKPNKQRETATSTSSTSSSTSRAIFSQADDHPPHRPVAKVPPHKVTGVKVLPSMPQINLKPDAKRTESPQKRQATPASGARNWQPTSITNERITTPEEPTSEEMLAHQKKDAEIACLMQNIQLDYEPSTLSPRGTNFESALGYFP
ncbi:hypothetical protein CAPTEDRAFT_221374 [Capitella teleta]|uniref:PID domain-containing protein n=1 Tax=Capitella teleta TaxID=283909 RepID=R7UV49_CAPTE|nr:hypothetical protein CAPTEDRAFT_221374 [Capitella teleta]|eukprot:ELU07822.1 hypothetical protein CAPTEDRAFT_221374 [Capitella teleta]